LIAYSSIIGAGLAFPHNPETALFVVGAVALTLIFIGIHNAWDAVEYVAVQLRPNPQGTADASRGALYRSSRPRLTPVATASARVATPSLSNSSSR